MITQSGSYENYAITYDYHGECTKTSTLVSFPIAQVKVNIMVLFVHKKWHWWGKQGFFGYIYDKLGVELVWNT